jgi:hypothetical protein
MIEESDKLKIFIFVPLSACGCYFSKFMDRLFAEFIPYNDFLDVEVKDIQGIEANSFPLFGNSVVIPNPPNQKKPMVFTSFLELRKFLNEFFN